MSKLPALLLRRPQRPELPAAGPGAVRARPLDLPRPRGAVGGARSRPVVHHGADALALLEVAPPAGRLQPGSLLVGFAVGAVVAGRGLPGRSRRP